MLSSQASELDLLVRTSALQLPIGINGKASFPWENYPCMPQFHHGDGNKNVHFLRLM